MPEATVIIVDNSEWMRNGDYVPNRLQAQLEAANFLCEAKTSQNAENTCALIAMGGQAPKVLLTLTPDIGKMLTSTQTLEPSGNADLMTALLVAQLTLNHRQNTIHRQRIVAFVGSPLHKHTVEEMKLTAARLKKAGILLDIVSFGEVKENQDKLNALFEASAQPGEPTTLLVCEPSSQNFIVDKLISSPIVQGSEGGAPAAGVPAGAGPGAAPSFPGGVNPDLDPELASVLRESMMEYERARGAQGDATAPSSGPVPMVIDEDEELRRALEMSMLAAAPAPAPALAQAPAPQTPAPAPAPQAASEPEPMELSEEQLMRMAMEMSMAEQATGQVPATPAPAPATATSVVPPPAPVKPAQPKAGDADAAADSYLSEMLKDKDFLSDLLGTLPGVNPDDAQIKEMVASITGQEKKPEEKKDEKPEGK